MLWTKEEIVLFQSLQIGCVWQQLSVLSQIKLCLKLHFLLPWSSKVNQRWKLWVFPGLLGHVSSPGYVCALPDSLAYMRVFRRLISPSISLHSLFLPRPFDLCIVCIALTIAPGGYMATAAAALHLPLNAFNRHCPGIHSALGKHQSRRNKSKPLSQSFKEQLDRSKHKITILWE